MKLFIGRHDWPRFILPNAQDHPLDDKERLTVAEAAAPSTVLLCPAGVGRAHAVGVAAAVAIDVNAGSRGDTWVSTENMCCLLALLTITSL